jgi:DNA-binding MarR family transcriptional regulator
MSTEEKFTQVLRDWVETFMRRSMHEFVIFSKDSGLSMTQMHTLFHLHHCNTCGVSDVGERLGVTNAAASQLVDRLVHFGMVVRIEDPIDRRAKQLSLTNKGNDLVARSIEARRNWMEHLTTELTADEQRSIITALSMLTAAARKLDADLGEGKRERSKT